MADPLTGSETLARMDEGWATFNRRVTSLPTERLAVRIGDDGWTRRQMLAHIATWHDLTVDRLAKFADTGEPTELGDTADAINARAARSSEGRTTGEIVLALGDSYRRLRRAVATLSDDQLGAHEAWAGAIIAGNSYEHYAEHLADLEGDRR